MHFEDNSNAQSQRLGTLGMLCPRCARCKCLGGPPEAASLALRPSLLVVYSHNCSRSLIVAKQLVLLAPLCLRLPVVALFGALIYISSGLFSLFVLQRDAVGPPQGYSLCFVLLSLRIGIILDCNSLPLFSCCSKL